jgi:hypothetical protein
MGAARRDGMPASEQAKVAGVLLVRTASPGAEVVRIARVDGIDDVSGHRRRIG